MEIYHPRKEEEILLFIIVVSMAVHGFLSGNQCKAQEACTPPHTVPCFPFLQQDVVIDSIEGVWKVIKNLKSLHIKFQRHPQVIHYFCDSLCFRISLSKCELKMIEKTEQILAQNNVQPWFCTEPERVIIYLLPLRQTRQSRSMIFSTKL